MLQNILDTNVLVRFLVGDNSVHQSQARRWFKEAEIGRRAIIVTPIVIAETSFVLESFYKIPRDKVADSLEVFVGQRWLKIEDRDILSGLWPSFRSGLHFVDSYLLAWADLNHGSVLTFDRKIQKK